MKPPPRKLTKIFNTSRSEKKKDSVQNGNTREEVAAEVDETKINMIMIFARFDLKEKEEDVKRANEGLDRAKEESETSSKHLTRTFVEDCNRSRSSGRE